MFATGQINVKTIFLSYVFTLFALKVKEMQGNKVSKIEQAAAILDNSSAHLNANSGLISLSSDRPIVKNP